MYKTFTYPDVAGITLDVMLILAMVLHLHHILTPQQLATLALPKYLTGLLSTPFGKHQDS